MNRKKILCATLALTVAALGCACSKNEQSDDPVSEETTVVETVIESETEVVETEVEETEIEETEPEVVSPADEEPVIVDNENIITIINEDPAFEGVADSEAGIPSNIVFSDWRFTSYDGLTFNNAPSTTDLRSNVSAPVYAPGDTVEFTYVSIGVNSSLAVVSYDINDDGTFDADSMTVLAYGSYDPWSRSDCYLINDANFVLTYGETFVNCTTTGEGSFIIPSDSTNKIYFIVDCRNMETLYGLNAGSVDDVTAAINSGNYLVFAPIVVE